MPLSEARFRILSTEPGVQVSLAPWLSLILSLASHFDFSFLYG